MAAEQSVFAVDSTQLQDRLVLSKVDYMAYSGEPELIAVTRGSIWNYMVKRFEIDRRNLGHIVVARFAGREPAPSGLEFVRRPESLQHAWPVDQVDGLVVPTLRDFVDSINSELETITTDQGKSRALRYLLGYNMSVTTLRHMDTTAAYFEQPA